MTVKVKLYASNVIYYIEERVGQASDIIDQSLCAFACKVLHHLISMVGALYD